MERTDGGILLFHDTREYTAEHLDEVLAVLTAQGFKFTTLDNRALFPQLNVCADETGRTPSCTPIQQTCPEP